MNTEVVNLLFSLLKEKSIKMFDGEISYSYITGYLLSVLEGMAIEDSENISRLVKECNRINK